MGGARQAMVVGVLASVCSVALTLIMLAATLFALALARDNREGGYCESIDHPGKCENEGLLALAGFSLTGLAGWGVAAGVGLCQRRRWARWSTIIVFLAWAVLITGAVVASASSEGSDITGTGVLLWLAFTTPLVTIAALAARVARPEPPTLF